jgi:hypothetical protein
MANALKSYITEVQTWNENNKIKPSEAAEGWQDVQDELVDEWLPRQVFIYFDDRVYLGHFDSFSYQRVAETELINYELRFTVTRQIIITSNDVTKRPVTTQSSSSGIYYVPSAVNISTEDLSSKLAYYKTKTPQAIADAKLEILRCKEAMVYYEELSATPISDPSATENIKALDLWVQQIRDAVDISRQDQLYGFVVLMGDQRLAYYDLAKQGNQSAYNAAASELSYVRAMVASWKREQGGVSDYGKQVWGKWIKEVHEHSGIDKYEAWENELSI